MDKRVEIINEISHLSDGFDLSPYHQGRLVSRIWQAFYLGKQFEELTAALVTLDNDANMEVAVDGK